MNLRDIPTSGLNDYSLQLTVGDIGYKVIPDMTVVIALAGPNDDIVLLSDGLGTEKETGTLIPNLLKSVRVNNHVALATGGRMFYGNILLARLFGRHEWIAEVGRKVGYARFAERIDDEGLELDESFTCLVRRISQISSQIISEITPRDGAHRFSVFLVGKSDNTLSLACWEPDSNWNPVLKEKGTTENGRLIYFIGDPKAAHGKINHAGVAQCLIDSDRPLESRLLDILRAYASCCQDKVNIHGGFLRLNEGFQYTPLTDSSWQPTPHT